MMMLYWLQQTGNKPITLMGGGTTMVGDPSGKDETRARSQRSRRSSANKDGITRRVRQGPALSATGTHDAIMLDNAEWLTKLNWIEMLRDIGRHFSVNRMLTMDSVRAAARARAGDELHRVQLHGPARPTTSSS